MSGVTELGNGRLSPEAIMMYEMFSRVGNSTSGQAYIRVGGVDQQQIVEQIGNYYYVGYAQPTVGETEAKWKIKRVDVTGPIYTKWADGSTLYNKQWSQKGTYTYQ